MLASPVKTKEELVIPDRIRCPITHLIMREPVIASDGQVYEKEAIHVIFETTNVSPMTRERFETKDVIPNQGIRTQALQFIQKIGAQTLALEDEIYCPFSLRQEMLQAVTEKNLEKIRSLAEIDIRLLTRSAKSMVEAGNMYDRRPIAERSKPLSNRNAFESACEADLGSTEEEQKQYSQFLKSFILLIKQSYQAYFSSYIPSLGWLPTSLLLAFHLEIFSGSAQPIGFMMFSEPKPQINLEDWIRLLGTATSSFIQWPLKRLGDQRVNLTAFHLALLYKLEWLKPLIERYSYSFELEQFSILHMLAYPSLFAVKMAAYDPAEILRGNLVDLVKLLIANGAKIESKMKEFPEFEGYTPLHLAVEARNNQLVEALLNYNADINAKTAKGETAFQIAIAHDLPPNQQARSIMRLLVSHGANPRVSAIMQPPLPRPFIARPMVPAFGAVGPFPAGSSGAAGSPSPVSTAEFLEELMDEQHTKMFQAHKKLSAKLSSIVGIEAKMTGLERDIQALRAKVSSQERIIGAQQAEIATLKLQLGSTPGASPYSAAFTALNSSMNLGQGSAAVSDSKPSP